MWIEHDPTALEARKMTTELCGYHDWLQRIRVASLKQTLHGLVKFGKLRVDFESHVTSKFKKLLLQDVRSRGTTIRTGQSMIFYMKVTRQIGREPFNSDVTSQNHRPQTLTLAWSNRCKVSVHTLTNTTLRLRSVPLSRAPEPPARMPTRGRPPAF